MLIVTGVFNNPIKPYLAMSGFMKQSAMKLGYECMVLEMSKNQNINEDPSTGRYFPLAEEKPLIIKRAIELCPGVDSIAFVDCDCLIVDRFDEIIDDFDFAVTLRRRNESKSMMPMFDGFLNSGVVAVRINKNGLRLLSEWIDTINIKPWGDQEALNRSLMKYSTLEKFGVFDAAGAKVNVADCEIYNNFYFDHSSQKAKVIHFKGKADRVLYNGYVDRLLGIKNAI